MKPTKAPCTGRAAPWATASAGARTASAIRRASRALFRRCVGSCLGRGSGRHGRDALTQRDRQLIAARQLFEMSEGEMLQEERRRPIEQRSPQTLSASSDVDQAAFMKRFQNAADGHAANLLDLDTADRLSIGDDREGLE